MPGKVFRFPDEIVSAGNTEIGMKINDPIMLIFTSEAAAAGGMPTGGQGRVLVKPE